VGSTSLTHPGHQALIWRGYCFLSVIWDVVRNLGRSVTISTFQMFHVEFAWGCAIYRSDCVRTMVFFYVSRICSRFQVWCNSFFLYMSTQQTRGWGCRWVKTRCRMMGRRGAEIRLSYRWSTRQVRGTGRRRSQEAIVPTASTQFPNSRADATPRKAWRWVSPVSLLA